MHHWSYLPISSDLYTDKMSWVGCNVKPLPVKWEGTVTIKEPADNDKLGWIDPVDLSGGSRKSTTTFRFLGAEGAPLSIKPVKTPYDCFTLADVIVKGRGKLTVRVQINKEIWESLNNLDSLFKAFLIRNRTKLFSKQDAEYIGRDNSAVALKFKALAQRGPDGEPLWDSYITLRVNGRVGEIETLETKDGPTGKFVSSVTWAPRTTPLANTATRFSLVTAVTDTELRKGVLTVSDTLPIEGPIPVGSQRMRYVGPGDIATDRNGGCVARYLLVRPLYWAIAPGGNASITLSLDSVILQNGMSVSEDKSSIMAALEAPPGFELAPPPQMNRANTGGAQSAAGGGTGGSLPAFDMFAPRSNAAHADPAQTFLSPNMEKRRRAATGEYIAAFSAYSEQADAELARRMDERPQNSMGKLVASASSSSAFSDIANQLNRGVITQAEVNEQQRREERAAREEHELMMRTSKIPPIFEDEEDE